MERSPESCTHSVRAPASGGFYIYLLSAMSAFLPRRLFIVGLALPRPLNRLRGLRRQHQRVNSLYCTHVRDNVISILENRL
jgi:hypothetical protein